MDTGTLAIHTTAGVSFVLYALALAWRLRRITPAGNVIWTAAFALMLLHVLLAFHFAHHWSHRAAYDDTARQTAELFGIRWGGGVFANYALLLVWAVEVVRWWSGGFSRAAQWFMAFMWFNGTVVFGHGLIRWLGVAGFLMLAVMLWVARRKPESPPVG
jgi:hypothetical protein